MKSFSVLIASLLLVSLAACSSGDKKSEASAAAEASKTSPPPTRGDAVQRYSLTELNSVATALRVIADEGVAKPKEDVGSDLIGCAMTSKEAMSLMMPIKAVIDQSVRTESESYAENPKTYSNEKGFESCAANCACGILSDVVEGSNESSIPATASKIHARNKQRLSLKASKQSASDSKACARKANWLCGSELLGYLRKEATGNAE